MLPLETDGLGKKVGNYKLESDILARMDTIDQQTPRTLLSSGDDHSITPEHRAWMNTEIRATLEKKARGELSYKPLEQVRREFGLDAS